MSVRNINPDRAPPIDGAILVEDLLRQCHQMLAELKQFRDFLSEQKKEHLVDIRLFHNSVLSELKSLEKVSSEKYLLRYPLLFLLTDFLKLSSADTTAEKTVHTLRSSNLPFYYAVWDAAKSSTGLITFNKRFYWAQPPTRSSKRAGHGKKQCALVDVVTQNGLEWIKVSTISETRLLFELAKAGWEGADSSSDDSEDKDEDNAADVSTISTSYASPPSPINSDNPVEIVRLAIDLRKASLATLVRYKHPAVRIILPKIPASPSPQTLSIFSQILSTGAKIQHGPELLPFPTSEPSLTPASLFSLHNIFTRLLPDPHAPLTPTLNIDCTILLALVSDLSHSSCTPQSPTHHPAIKRQIALEARDPLLPDSLYPALKDHDLVCTTEAAERMQEIVTQIGTPSERTRGALLLADECVNPEEANGWTGHSDSILARFAATSEHPVPKTLRLPIKITPAKVNMTQLPPIATAVAAQLTPINISVFLYGWQAGITTVSSNRTVAKTIESVIAAGVSSEGDDGMVGGPEVWLCETARSLVGKEKGRRI